MRTKKKYRAPFAQFERDQAFRDLQKLMQSARPPLAMIGAGASVGSGYPAWRNLLELLKKEALVDSKNDWRRSLDDMTDAPWTAEILASRFPVGKLGRLIRQTYRSGGALGEPHLTLGRMPFPHYLTTNYDPSIEESLQQAGKKFRRIVWPNEHQLATRGEDLSRFLIGIGDSSSERSVVYLHGRYDSDEDDIVLTESDYVARYIRSDDARRKLMAIFLTHPVLFVGFSMNDPDLSNIMREVTARLRTSTPCHFALMGYKSETEREAIRARMTGKFGVSPVFYSLTPVDENGDPYENLLFLLDALTGEQRENRVEVDSERKEVSRFDPDDPHKGRFGGLAMANGRMLSVTRKGGSENEGFLKLRFTVEQLPGATSLQDDVTFHLHPTFPQEEVISKVRKGQATYDCWAWGAFTIGATVDGGETRLELDLAEEARLPLWFRRI